MKNLIINEVDKLLPELINSIKKICSIDSRRDIAVDNAPYGIKVVNCLNETLSLAKSLGFEIENFSNQVGTANWGPNTGEYIACIGHLDVVDVNGVWRTDPFTCSEIDGILYARGVLDNKGPILCCLYALKVLVNLGYEFPKKVKIIFGTNEETGMEDMKYYFNSHTYPIMGWTPDCKYPVVYAERGRLKFCFKTEIENSDELIKFMNSYILNQTDLSISLGIDYYDQEFGKNQVRSTEMFQNDKECGLNVVCSYPASYKLKDIIENLRKLENTKIKFEILSNLNPVFFDKESYLVKKLEKAYEEIMNEDGKAVTTTGGTYAKVVKNIVPFGPSFKNQKGIGHLPNEWMRICDIKLNTQIYAMALYELMEGLK